MVRATSTPTPSLGKNADGGWLRSCPLASTWRSGTRSRVTSSVTLSLRGRRGRAWFPQSKWRSRCDRRGSPVTRRGLPGPPVGAPGSRRGGGDPAGPLTAADRRPCPTAAVLGRSAHPWAPVVRATAAPARRRRRRTVRPPRRGPRPAAAARAAPGAPLRPAHRAAGATRRLHGGPPPAGGGAAARRSTPPGPRRPATSGPRSPAAADAQRLVLGAWSVARGRRRRPRRRRTGRGHRRRRPGAGDHQRRTAGDGRSTSRAILEIAQPSVVSIHTGQPVGGLRGRRLRHRRQRADGPRPHQRPRDRGRRDDLRCASPTAAVTAKVVGRVARRRYRRHPGRGRRGPHAAELGSSAPSRWATSRRHRQRPRPGRRPQRHPGIVSAARPHRSAERRRRLDNLIQTDAAINPGNSRRAAGQPAGQVVGINTADLQRRPEHRLRPLDRLVQPLIDRPRAGRRRGRPPTAGPGRRDRRRRRDSAPTCSSRFGIDAT